MRRFVLLLSILALAGCTSVPDIKVAPDLLNDALFAPPTLRIDERDALAMSPEMIKYLHNEMTERLHSRGRRQALLDALYDRGQLKLEYDSAMTRNASEAFAARSGNCLSLVIMTGAFAKEMGLPVRYQTVFTDETWARQGDIYLNVGHVNLSLGPSAMDAGRLRGPDLLTIDFIPGTDLVGSYTRTIGETTIVAMYLNNRAAESIATGELDNAYAFVRAAIRHEPRFLPAYNTLGAVYWRHGNAREAAAAFGYVLQQEPANRNAMANLVPVLADLGRGAESKALAQRLAALEPEPPFGYFKRGMAALQDGDYRSAKQLFSKEVDRAAYYHEFHYWLAIAEVGLGELDDARRHLNAALEISGSGREHDIYAAKLQRISRYR
jgi:tetratricopeptide (TPR) repeat protein